MPASTEKVFYRLLQDFFINASHTTEAMSVTGFNIASIVLGLKSGASSPLVVIPEVSYSDDPNTWYKLQMGDVISNPNGDGFDVVQTSVLSVSLQSSVNYKGSVYDFPISADFLRLNLIASNVEANLSVHLKTNIF